MTIDLAALAKLAAEATPGPWVVNDSRPAADAKPRDRVGRSMSMASYAAGDGYDDYGCD